jgi:hypothetical protein
MATSIGTVAVPIGAVAVPIGIVAVPIGIEPVPIGIEPVPIGIVAVPIGIEPVPGQLRMLLMKSEPGAAATGSSPYQSESSRALRTRSLTLPVLTSSSN